jgi:hypothetical protein
MRNSKVCGSHFDKHRQLLAPNAARKPTVNRAIQVDQPHELVREFERIKAAPRGTLIPLSIQSVSIQFQTLLYKPVFGPSGASR